MGRNREGMGRRVREDVRERNEGRRKKG